MENNISGLEEEYEGDYDPDNEIEQAESISFREFDVTASPNDFNLRSLFDFIQQGIFVVPGFQRNYVWDKVRASKLIESIFMGIPIPQIFLYEEVKNRFTVIDGQQRLMTIYYFFSGRFPKKDRRGELRLIFDREGAIPENILHNNAYFEDFNLKLPEKLPERVNPLHGLNYKTLPKELQRTFNLKTIRNIVIRQIKPPENHSIMYELFYRLNTGGMNLTPQEIRMSLYHSKFYIMLHRVNILSQWRILQKKETPDLHMKDIEIILRGFAMLDRFNTISKGEDDPYKSSMTRFLNGYSDTSSGFTEEHINYMERLFITFVEACAPISSEMFSSKATGRFNISMYEAIFVALTGEAYSAKSLDIRPIQRERLELLKENPEFIKAALQDTTSKSNIEDRTRLARSILLG